MNNNQSIDQSDENVADLTPKKKARVAQLALKARIRSIFRFSLNQSFPLVIFVSFAAISCSFYSYLSQTTAFHCKICKTDSFTNKIHETANNYSFFKKINKIHSLNVLNLLTVFLIVDVFDEGT